MKFQFMCPAGHLLEGDSSQSGQQLNCPTCGVLFVIPQADPKPAEAIEQTSSDGNGDSGGELSESPFGTMLEEEPKTLHIPCPNGHELETPDNMLGQEVLCPVCQAKFLLQYRDSVEAQAKRRAAREQKEREDGQKWLQRAIIAAVFVVGSLIFMIALSATR